MIRRPATSKEFRRFIQTLSKIDSSNHQLRLARPFPGSLDWITKHPSYCEWQDQGPKAPNILYFSGPPGSGTAVIASHLSTTLRNAVPTSVVISYSFSRQDLRTQPIATFYVSLIRQLLLSRPSLFRRVSSICDWIQEEEIFSFEILRSIFLSLLKGSSPDPVFCVIHGPDECESFPFDRVVDLLHEYQRSSAGVCKFMVLGEDPRHGAFRHAAGICRDIDLADESWRAASVGAYVQSRIEKLADEHREWEQGKDDIVKKLSDPPTLFLQAALGMRLVETAEIPSTRGAVVELAEKLPSSLDTMYKMAWQRGQRKCPIPLPPLLPWVLHSVRPLDVNELAVVAALASPGTISIDHLKMHRPLCIAQDLRGVEGIFIKLIGRQVYPIHRTMGPILAGQWRLANEDPDSMILIRILDYLETILGYTATVHNDPVADPDPSAKDGADLDASSMDGAEFGLMSYTVTHWPEHYKRARDRPQIKDRLLEIFGKKEKATAWSKLYQKYAGVSTEKYSVLDNPLKIASRFGLADMAKDTIQQAKSSEEFNKESFDKALSDALDLAVGHGHEETVTLLLEEGAQSTEAMCLAANGGFVSILEKLVNAKPDMINEEDQFGRPPFTRAALNGHVEAVDYLLKHGANGKVVVGHDRTALHCVAITGQTKILRSLIAAGVDVNARSETGSDALREAAEGGFDEIVTLLLNQGAELNGQNSDGFTALLLAINHGHDSTCDVLFAAGADVQVLTEEGLSPIHLAAREGNLGILRKLLQRSKDAVDDEEVTEGQQEAGLPVVFDASNGVLSPLHLAASHGHLEIVRELLKYARYKSQRGRATALLLAAAGGYADLVEEFLKSEITTLVQDPEGNTALHLATQKQHADIVAQLLNFKSGSS